MNFLLFNSIVKPESASVDFRHNQLNTSFFGTKSKSSEADMDAFISLKSACNQSITPHKNFDQVEVGDYNVVSFQLLDTKYGKKLKVIFENFHVFLPDRFSKVIDTEDKVNSLNSIQYVMKFRGKDTQRQNRLILDFDAVTDAQIPWDIGFESAMDH